MSTREDHILVNNLSTHVLTVGGWLDDPLSSRHVVLVIPGNPGLVGFYTPFLAALHSQLNVPVWAISHAGHDLPSRCRETLRDNLDNYNVDGQTRHKLAFIAQHIPPDVRITLIGHSIGCKIILDAMKSTNLSNQVDKCYLLFPTIERMAVTPNGKFINGVVKPFVFIIILASWLFHILPFFLKRFLISIWFFIEGSPTYMSSVTVGLVKPKILRNVFYMAYDEMDNVTELDKEPIERFGDKLVFYYGLTDQWAPLNYYTDLKRSFPNVRIMACERGYHHSFVLSSGTPVGLMVAEWINAEKAARRRQE